MHTNLQVQGCEAQHDIHQPKSENAERFPTAGSKTPVTLQQPAPDDCQRCSAVDCAEQIHDARVTPAQWEWSQKEEHERPHKQSQ